jgi:K+-sensing histidine kinase KdpD
VTLLASTAGDVAKYALAAFLLLSGLGLAYMLFQLGGTFSRLSSFIRGTERDLLPVITKTGGTVDRVNLQLDKMDRVTDSAVDMAESADTAVRSVTHAIQTPVTKLSGLAAGLTHGASKLKASRDWSEAVRVGKDAAARREADLADELRRTGAEQP